MQKLKPKWLALRGVPDFDDAIVRQIAPEPPSQKKSSQRNVTTSKTTEEDNTSPLLLRSDLIFEDGELSCEFWLDHPGNKVQFRLGVTDSEVTFVGINLQGGAYGIARRNLQSSSEKIVSESVASPDAPPPIGKWTSLQIHNHGSLLSLTIDGIRVANLQAQLARSPLELVMRGYGRTQVRNIAVSSRKPQVFIVMQFTDEYNQLYREVIVPVCTEFGYDVIRADNIYNNSLIVEDISRSIRESSLVIADITPNNANVYYEVGFAHGIEKPTILLSDRKREKLPFDISGFRLIFYDNSIGGKSEVELALRKHLEALRA